MDTPSEDRLRLMLSVSGAGGSWDWDIATGRIIGDPPFAALYGLTLAQAAAGIGPRDFYAIIHPQDQARIRLAIGGMLRGAEVFSKEYRLQLPDGTWRWVHARGRCQYSGETPMRFLGALVDITEQKRVEEQLRIAQTAGGIGTFEYVLGYATVSVSRQFCDLLGLHPAHHLPVHTINALVLPGDPPVIDTAGSADPGTASQVQCRIRRADTGKQRWLTRRGEYLPHDGTDPRFSGVIYDITEAKAVEEELRTLSETLESRVEERTRERDRIWKLSRDLYVECDRAGLCRSINPAWMSEVGHSPAAMLGQPLAAVIHPEDRPGLAALLGRLLRDGAADNVDLRLITAAGEVRIFSWTCVLEGDWINAAGRDVTRRNELEEQLRQSQKMEAVGQLTGGIAHDFNNLLTGISGGLELLQLRTSQGRFNDLGRYIALAQGAAERAAALTHRLLAFSRRQTLAPRSVQVNTLVGDMEELIRGTVGPAIRVETALAPEVWTTLCDSNQLENALLNLCINARDAMPDGGHLTIATANEWLRPGDAGAKGGQAPEPYVTLSVTDTGTGMTPDVVARAFDPFFTTKPLGVGTGLGLSMIYGFAKQSGGHLQIDTQPGRGTTMRIQLPRHAADVAAEEPPRSPGGAARSGGGESVLVIDDEAMIRLLVIDLLGDLGYRSMEAEDGETGLAILRSSARIDLLITDVGLPNGLNGRQIADAARTLRPGLRVIFITGYAESAILRSDNLEPGMHVVTKPFALDVLAAKISEILA